MEELIKNDAIRTEERDLLIKLRNYLSKAGETKNGESILIEQINNCLKKPLEEPDMRHPKIQSLMSAKARLSIELGIIESVIFDPEHEYDCGMESDYTTPLTDKIYKEIKRIREKFVEKNNILHYPILDKYGRKRLMGASDMGMALIDHAEKGDIEGIRLILKQRVSGFNIDTENDSGYSALLVAVMKGRSEIVDELYEHGANLYHAAHGGKHALAIAVKSDNLPMARHLLEMGFDVNHRSQYGSTALMESLKSSKEMILLLLENGADAVKFIEQIEKHYVRGKHEKRGLLEMVKNFVENKRLQSLIKSEDRGGEAFNF